MAKKGTHEIRKPFYRYLINKVKKLCHMKLILTSDNENKAKLDCFDV